MTSYSLPSGHPPHSLHSATKIASASRCASMDAALSGERSASIGETLGGMMLFRWRRRAPTPHFWHQPKPRLSRLTASPARMPYHADVNVGVLPGCIGWPPAATSMNSPCAPTLTRQNRAGQWTEKVNEPSILPQYRQLRLVHQCSDPVAEFGHSDNRGPVDLDPQIGLVTGMALGAACWLLLAWCFA